MSKNTKIILIPLIASISFIVSFWVAQVRTADTVIGLSADFAGGSAVGIGIGLILVLLYSVKKQSSS